MRNLYLVPVFLLACSSGEHADPARGAVQPNAPSADTTTALVPVESLPAPPQDTISRALVAAGREFGTTEREVRQFLGAPDDVTLEPFVNQHDATQTDTIIRLVYRDVTIALYRITASRAEILLQVILSKPGRRLPFGVDVGMRREDVVALQAPTRQGLDEAGLETLEYQDSMDNPDLVRFVLKRDRVQRIEWVHFID